MNPHGTMRALRLLALAALGAACGSAMGGGIAGTSAVLGTISGFGSVVVGGIAFDAGGAEITIEGDPVTEEALRLGMVAVVRGVVEPGGRRGVAERVAVDNLAEGPIEAIDVTAGTIRLLSQQVLVDGSTVFDPVAFSDLRVGETVDVGGFLDANGRIRATRIAPKLVEPEIELRGFVAGLDPAAETFRIGALLVRYGGAFIEEAPAGGLRDGLFVEIEADEPPIDDVFEAVEITVLDPTLMTEEGDGLDLEGFVTEVLSAKDFVLNGAQRVRVTPETRFEGGGPFDIVPDARLEVEGVADAGGVLIAREVELLSPSERVFDQASERH